MRSVAMHEPDLQDIREAHERIRGHIHRTPVLTCETLNRQCHAELFFKCENFQKVGAFKIRGAANAVFSLTGEEASNGVATHSSGNHAAALAQAARWREIKAYVVMPENAPEVKRKAVAGYGAKIVFCKPTLEDRERTLAAVLKKTGAAMVHPYNDYRVIAGQATAALELCEEIRDLDAVVAPVGGGGLISGTALSVHVLSPNTKVMAAEPQNADDAFQSFKAGHIIPVQNPDTIADGLRTSLGDKTFSIIRKWVDTVIPVSEKDIVQAMRMIWERMKIIVEPSSSVPLGAVMTDPGFFSGKRIGIILSGGNVDLASLPFS